MATKKAARASGLGRQASGQGKTPAAKAAPAAKAKVKAKVKAKAPATAPAVVSGGPRPQPAGLPARVTSRTLSMPIVAAPVAPVAAPPPPPRDEMIAPRDIARLTRYGERFGSAKIDVRMLPLPLPVTSGAIAVCDPAVPKSWRVFDRPVGGGQFRTMLSVARDAQNAEKLAAVVVHVGRPPIQKWTVAHFGGGKKPKSADQLPRITVTSGWLVVLDGGDAPGSIEVPAASGVAPIEVPLADGRRALALPCGNGDYAAYWAVDAADKAICLVVDFDRFSQKDWKARPTS
nr:DUF4241 domain-containing protein [Kofleriaceae bacterium]